MFLKLLSSSVLLHCAHYRILFSVCLQKSSKRVSNFGFVVALGQYRVMESTDI